jgi:hypothetical protein
METAYQRTEDVQKFSHGRLKVRDREWFQIFSLHIDEQNLIETYCLEKVEKGLVRLKWLRKGRRISVKVLKQCLFAYVFPYLTWTFPFLPKTQREAVNRKFRVGIRIVYRLVV